MSRTVEPKGLSLLNGLLKSYKVIAIWVFWVKSQILIGNSTTCESS